MIRVFVTDPQHPSESAQVAIRRAEAAAKRAPGGAQVRVLGFGSEEATLLGAAVEPTVAVGDMLVAVGQPPMAGHLVRAIAAALEGNDA